MEKVELEIIYQDDNLFVLNKPAGITLFSERKTKEKTLIDYLLEKYPYLKNIGPAPRDGIVHRLDKDTSGILLLAKNNQTLEFLQNQFQERKIKKRYLALVIGHLKNKKGEIKTLIGRSPKERRKQKVYLFSEPLASGKREAITIYRVLQRFSDYDLIEVEPLTGRKHQIRVHLAYLNHPIAGDRLYGFKNQICPENLKRQFLHAHYLKIKLPNGKIKKFRARLPNELKKVIDNLNKKI